ncbi:MAG TPA: S41 family peptidase [Verrucomicrobiae bacterium]|nr:S41 family peptidase [Verrucomicrobiae bacterium]
MTIKRITIALIGILLGVNLVIAARIYSESSARQDKDNPYTQMELITKVMELIRKEYVDADKATYTNLTYGALRGMLNSLDPHSQFMEPQVYQDMKEETEGEFGGLGIQISMSREGFLTVIAPMEGTPGARAGLLPGDRIIKIEGRITDKMSLQEAVHLLRGEPGTKVTMTVFRQRAKDPGEKIKDYTIERARIKVDSVKDINGHNFNQENSFPLLEDKIGYVRITQFNEPTAGEFEKALNKLEDEGMTALILDLRNNPGGLLESARRVASEFVPAGQLIVSTEGRDPTQKSIYRSVGGKKLLSIPLVVLVNEGSASGSEIVAGALQDLKRAVLVGETTFGKGSVQSILQLGDGSAMRLTTAKYYTPSHKVINERGITPDIVVPVSQEDEAKLAEQRARASLPETNDVAVIEGTAKTEPIPDVQLDRALDVLKGVKLFARQMKLVRQNVKATLSPETATP